MILGYGAVALVGVGTTHGDGIALVGAALTAGAGAVASVGVGIMLGAGMVVTAGIIGAMLVTDGIDLIMEDIIIIT